MFSKQNIKDAFGVDEIAITPLMLQKQELYRQIMSGHAPWNDKDTPSLMLASVVVNETTDEALNDFETEVVGTGAGRTNPRAEFLNEQYLAFVDNRLEEMVVNFLSEGETILRPYMTVEGVDVNVYATDFYAPLAYDTRGNLTDVVFVATSQPVGKTVYKLFERHTWNEEAQTNAITYRAFKSDRMNIASFGAENNGTPVALTEVPEWAHLADFTMGNMPKPLFVHVRNKTKLRLESPQRQGLPMYAKAVESGALEKLDKQESRTDWEFEGGELAVHANIDAFRPGGGKKGEAQRPLELPKGKKRLYRTVDLDGIGMDVFSPTLRVAEHGERLNQLRRDVELQSGMSYGIISNNNQQDKTATEFKASKKRLINTVMQTQRIAGVAIDALLASWDKLLDIHGGVNIPPGEYEVIKQWNESLALDREQEFAERAQAQTLGWVAQHQNLAWYQEIEDEDVAMQMLANIQKEREGSMVDDLLRRGEEA